MKKILHYLCVLCVLFVCAACETQSTVNASFDVIDDPDAVVVGPVDTEGTTYIRIPVSLFGDDINSVTGSTANVYLNGGLVLSSVNLGDYTHEVDDTVRFSLGPVSAGDVLGIQIIFSTTATVYYEGTINDENEDELLLSVM
jgi:archaellum component FlaG (FlaF/FlaG flagellin family)